MKKFNKIFLSIFLALTPSFAFAVNSSLDFRGFLKNIMDQLDLIPQFIIGLAVLYLMLNIFTYIQSGSDLKKLEEATKMITYSVIAIFIMMSVWGLVRVLIGTFNLDNAPISPITTDNINISAESNYNAPGTVGGTAWEQPKK
ncbi:MAG: hypothetical protein WCO84_02225 [bacterium]